MVFPGSIRPPLEACSNNVSTRGQIQARHRTSRQQQQREQQSSSSRVPLRQQSIQGAGAHRLSLISNAAMLAGLQPTAAESATATRLDLPPCFGPAQLPVTHHPAGGTAAAEAAAAAAAASCSSPLPEALLRLADPSAAVVLPPPHSILRGSLDIRELDKLVSTLGRNKATWRRSLVLSQWLQESGHVLDDRLCTTLIRVCSEHGQAVTALSVYEWMKAPPGVGGAGLGPTVFTYTAAMRAALAAGLLDRALQVWDDAQAAHQAGLIQLDCRLCITYIEVCSRKGLTDRALAMYSQMKAAARGSKLAPTVHAYTAAMRAATEGGQWARGLEIFADMKAAGVVPTGHAFAAAISACAAGSNWQLSVSLFEDMCQAGIKPDVVSCTALISALAAAGQHARAEAVVQWMLTTGVRPNVRTFTALLTALGNARQWDRAFEMLQLMQHSSWGGVAPNAYTYSALLRCLGECGEWQRAESLFGVLERQALQQAAPAAAAASVGRSSTATAGSSGISGSAAGLAAAATMAAVGGMQWPTGAAAVATGALAGGNSSSSSTAVPLGAGADAEVVPGVWGWQAAGSSRQTLVHRPSYFGEEDLHNLAAGSSSSNASSTGDAVASSVQPASAQVTATNQQQQQEQQQSLWTSASQLHGLNLQLQHAAAASHSSSAATGSRSHSPASHAVTGVTSSAMQQQQHVAWPAADCATDLVAAAAAAAGANSSALAQQVAQLALQQQIEQSMDLQLLMHQQQQAQALAASQRERQHQQQQQACLAHHPPPAAPIRTPQRQQQQAAAAAAAAAAEASRSSARSAGPTLVNEVVVRSLMLAYDQAGKWQECVGALSRGAALGVPPSPAMYAVAICAAGKAGQLSVADALFSTARGSGAADAATYGAMVGVLGMAGDAPRAEVVLRAMQAAGLTPGDYAYCGLIVAHSLSGDAAAAQRVRSRMLREHGPGCVSVHVYNALLAAADRAGAFGRALELLRCMRREGVEGDGLTQALAAEVGRKGAVEVEGQQLTAAALSAAMAAAGTLLIQRGLF